MKWEDHDEDDSNRQQKRKKEKKEKKGKKFIAWHNDFHHSSSTNFFSSCHISHSLNWEKFSFYIFCNIFNFAKAHREKKKARKHHDVHNERDFLSTMDHFFLHAGAKIKMRNCRGYSQKMLYNAFGLGHKIIKILE